MAGCLIGLDVGDKRVGIATADLTGMLASPFDTFSRAKGEAERKILELIAERKAVKVVVGMPFGKEGSYNEQCEKIDNFCRRLKRRADIEVVYVDEYLSSNEAKQRLNIRGLEEYPVRRQGKIDAAAAALILQAYLDDNF